MKFKICTVWKDRLRVTCAVPYTSAEMCPFSSIPDSITFSEDPRGGVARNEQIFNEFCRSRAELQLVAEHDVLVRLRGRENSLHKPVGEEARR